MNADLDMNNNSIFNVNKTVNNDQEVNKGQPVVELNKKSKYS